LLEVLAGIVLMFLLAAATALMRVRQWERWEKRERTPRPPLTDGQILFFAVLLVSTFVAAFLYFRAHFPH